MKNLNLLLGLLVVAGGAVAQTQGFIAGLTPDRRPEGAPVITQFESQPSPSTRLPSSHSSGTGPTASITPLPHSAIGSPVLLSAVSLLSDDPLVSPVPELVLIVSELAAVDPALLSAFERREDVHAATAATSTAVDGLTTRVDTTVAMALALSCQPLEKSKSNARITTTNNNPLNSAMNADSYP